MNKILISIILGLIILSSHALACSPGIPAIRVDCTLKEEYIPIKDNISLEINTERGNITIYPLRNGINLLLLEQGYRVSEEITYYQLTELNKYCEEDLEVSKEIIKELKAESDYPVVTQSSKQLVDGFEETNNDLYSCSKVEYIEKEGQIGYYYTQKSYCYSQPGWCYPTYHINHIELFFYNLINPSIIGFFSNLAIIGILFLIGIFSYKLFKKPKYKVLLKPNKINVFYTILVSLPLILLYLIQFYGVILGNWIPLVIGIILLLNYYTGSLINKVKKNGEIKKLYKPNPASFPITLILFIFWLLMFIDVNPTARVIHIIPLLLVLFGIYSFLSIIYYFAKK